MKGQVKYCGDGVAPFTCEFQNIEPGRGYQLAIVNTSGQLVKLEKEDASGQIKRQLDISDLPAGNYFLKVKVRHQVVSKPFMKVD